MMRYLGMIAFVWMAVFAVLSCDPEEDVLVGDAVDLSFSLDTVYFDTVFTELGSATRSFRVYNTSDQPVRIDRIRIEGRTDVDFRMNVDGIPGDEVTDVDIYPQDSLWVFVEVTVDPDQPVSVSPFVVQDRVIFETGSQEKEVWLEAWGQNANYFPSRFNRGIPVELSCNNDVIRWDSELPYVIYGEIFIDDCLLEIAAGTKIYVHGGIARNELLGVFNDGLLYTLPNGSIHSLGTEDDPVIIQGDRLEAPFQEVSGQWLGIIFGPLSQNNRLEHTIIKNSIFGCFADSLSQLDLYYTTIGNTAGAGLTAKRATVTADNCLFYDNASGAVQCIQGGTYDFTHCTMANYGFDASAVSLSNFQCYDPTCQSFSLSPLVANFTNSIIFGSRRDEIILSDGTGGATGNDEDFQVNLQNCVVRVDELLESSDGRYAAFFETMCVDCVDGDREDPLFVDRNEDDYHLDSLSIAIDQGILIPGFEFDLDGVARDAVPDAGCYERIE